MVETELDTPMYFLPLPSAQVDSVDGAGGERKCAGSRMPALNRDGDAAIGAMLVSVECACRGNFVGQALASSG